MKTFLVIDRSGFIRYVASGFEGHNNDRDVFIRTDLYLQRGQYFTGEEWIGADGIFKGDGPTMVFTAAGLTPTEQAQWKQAFSSFRVQVEHVFNRIQQWFPILGKKRWNYSDDLLFLAVHAACRVHNWLLQKRETYSSS